MIKVDIKGAEEQLKQFDHIVQALQSGKVQQVLKRSGQTLIDSARNVAPHKTGALRKSIGYISKNDKQYPNIALIGIRHDSAAYSAGKSYPGKYGNILQSDAKNSTRRAYKFMEMAMQINGNKVSDAIKAGLIQIIENPKINR